MKLKALHIILTHFSFPTPYEQLSNLSKMATLVPSEVRIQTKVIRHKVILQK